MQLIIIKMKGLSESPEYALLGKRQQQGTFVPSDWKNVRSLSRGRKVVILLNSNEVVLSSAVIPSKNRKQLLQAIPYALEDTLAEDIEDLHFAVHQDNKNDDNKSQVAVINRSVFINTLDFLKSKGISPHYALPEILTQKYEADACSILFENDGQSIFASTRLNQFEGFVCDQNMLDMFISEALDEQLPNTIYCNTKSDNLPEQLQQLPTSYIESNAIDYNSAISAFSLNLLTGFVRHNKQASTVNWKAWRPVMLIGGMLASIWMGIFFWQNNLLKNQSEQLNSQIVQVYKDTFPNGRIVDAAAQMNSALSKLRANAGQTIESPLPLIADVGPLLKEYKDLVLSELRYQENQLSMTIESPNLTLLETFKNDAAEKNRLKIEIKDSTTTANKVKAIILISPLPNSTAKTETTNKQGES